MIRKYLKNSGVILVYCVIAFIMYAGVDQVLKLIEGNQRLHKELIGQKEKYEQLSDHAAKLENKYVEQKELKKELEKQFSKEKDALEGRLKVLSNATYLIREKARKSESSDISYQGDRLKYVVNEIRFNDGPPVGYVLIFDDGRVVSKLYNHMIKVKTATSRDEDTGKYSIVNKADYILKSPSINTNEEKVWYNKPYPLDIVGGTALIDPTEKNQLRSKFHLWAPQLNANLNVGRSKSVSPGLGISTSGYGKTKNDLDFKFLQLGVDYSSDETFAAIVTPIMWRPFSNFVSNTYIGPGVSYSEKGLGFFIGFQVGL